MNASILTQNTQVNATNVFINGSVNTEVLLEMAVEMANKGNATKALEMAREALIFANRQNDYTKLYVHAFMAVLYLDMRNAEQTRWHIWKANNCLNENHFAFQTDKTYLNALLGKLSRLENQGKQIELLTVAA